MNAWRFSVPLTGHFGDSTMATYTLTNNNDSWDSQTNRPGSDTTPLIVNSGAGDDNITLSGNTTGRTFLGLDPITNQPIYSDYSAALVDGGVGIDTIRVFDNDISTIAGTSGNTR
jgi:hypothetical protein